MTAALEDTIAELARELSEARDRAPVAPLVAHHPELTVADAYAIQSLNAEGRATSGHKIGLTSQAMQEQLGVSEPDYGRIFSDELLETGATVARDELIAPRVEPEIAFVLAEDLGQGVTHSDVIDATKSVVPALEIIDSRIADWKIGLIDTVADNASCGRVVLGTQRTSVPGVALAAADVHLLVDGEEVAYGAALRSSATPPRRWPGSRTRSASSASPSRRAT